MNKLHSKSNAADLNQDAGSDCTSVQGLLADRIVFPMDQAAPAHQDFLRNQRKYRQNADLDRHLCLPAHGDHEKRLNTEQSFCTILQMLSASFLEKIPPLRSLQRADDSDKSSGFSDQLSQWNEYPDTGDRI